MAALTALDHAAQDFSPDQQNLDASGAGSRRMGSRTRSYSLTRARTFVVVVALAVVAMVVYLDRTRGWTATKHLIGESAQSTLRAVGATSQDAALSAKIKTALALSKYVSGSDIHVDAHDGYVLLTGQVPSEDVRQMVDLIARDTTGVGEVHNHLMVAGLASGTTATAATVAQTLARRVEFNLYVTKAFDLSLIQIEATDRTTVVVSGSVRNQAEKLLAERIASDSDGVQKVVSHLRVLPDASQ